MMRRRLGTLVVLVAKIKREQEDGSGPNETEYQPNMSEGHL